MITKNCKYCHVEFKQYVSGPMDETMKDDILRHYDKWHKFELLDLIINDIHSLPPEFTNFQNELEKVRQETLNIDPDNTTCDCANNHMFKWYTGVDGDESNPGNHYISILCDHSRTEVLKIWGITRQGKTWTERPNIEDETLGGKEL